MKKANTLILTLVLVFAFALVSNLILEKVSISFNTTKKQILYLQSKNHLEFLKEYISSLSNTEIKDVDKISIEDDYFLILATKSKEFNGYLLIVESIEHKIRTTYKLIL